VLATIRSAGGDLLVRAELFDVYRAGGHRSLAFSLRFQADDRTLTDAEVGDVRRAIIDAVQSSLPATLRG
jgi:phenylalanyl-tRNA synthetase beta chain